MKDGKFILAIAIALVAILSIPTALAAQNDMAYAKKPHHLHYKLIDLGTFGGPESFFNETNFFVSATFELSNRGLAVGGSATSVSINRPSNVCGGIGGGVPFVFHAFEWHDGVVTDLEALPGADNCSQAYGSTAAGVIAGTSENGEIDPLTGVIQERGVLWKNHQITDLGTLGGYESAAIGINNRGQVIGFATNTIPDPSACFLLGTQCRAFLWDDGVMQDLGTLGGPDSTAFLLNEGGQVSGVATTASPSASCFFPWTTDPFRWENGKMKDLGTLGGTCGIPLAMNNRGQVVGLSNLIGDSITHPFFWPGKGGKMQDLGTLGGSFGQPNAINESGDVVGYSNVTGDHAEFAALWRKGQPINLGSLDGDPCSTANAINSRGQVVGISTATCNYTTGRRAFLWEKGSMVDLNALIPPGTGMQLTLAEAINDRGEIAINGTPSGCGVVEQCGHAVLLIPCDENHPDIEGCDYSMVDANSVATHGAAPPATDIATPFNRTSPAFGATANMMLRRFGRGIGPWYRQPVPPAPRKE